jgi:hypothetical protein
MKVVTHHIFEIPLAKLTFCVVAWCSLVRRVVRL